MHVLTVISHPDPGSFSHAVAARFNAGVVHGGGTVETADLHQEGFDPRWALADLGQHEGRPSPPDIQAEQARIDRCQALCLVFPVFWFGMPAMVKGWIDRVWTFGWAYDQIEEPEKSLQPPRIAVVLAPAGGNPEHWRERRLEEAMHAVWGPGTLNYFGFADRRIHILAGSEGSDARRAALLARAHEVGLELPQAAATDPPPGD